MPKPEPGAPQLPHQTLSDADAAAYGAWLATLLANAWRNGLRQRPSDRPAIEQKRATRASKARAPPS